jgi:ABC-type transport system involved in cytochrome bd biosynthesis fused ATPase/permease subunit
MILVAGTVFAQSLAIVDFLYEESTFFKLIGIPYTILAACLTFAFNFYAIILAIAVLFPCCIIMIFYEFSKDYRRKLREY